MNAGILRYISTVVIIIIIITFAVHLKSWDILASVINNYFNFNCDQISDQHIWLGCGYSFLWIVFILFLYLASYTPDNPSKLPYREEGTDITLYIHVCNTYMMYIVPGLITLSATIWQTQLTFTYDANSQYTIMYVIKNIVLYCRIIYHFS